MAAADYTPEAGAPRFDPLPRDGRYRLHEELRLDQVFTPGDLVLLERLQAYCGETTGRAPRDVRAMLETGVRGLASIALCLDTAPPLWERSSLGGRERSGETLIEKLLGLRRHGLEWSLPTKAVLSRTFGIAKVNFWSSLGYALEGCDHQQTAALAASVREARDEAVYTRLTEELYVSFLTSQDVELSIRREAARQVVDLWEGRVSLATDRFCPMLRSAWSARCRTPRNFGTMMGTSEVVALLLQDCDPRFVEWFSHKKHLSDEQQAFEEFLFDLSFESLARVRAMLREEGRAAVGPDEVADLLGYPQGGLSRVFDDAKSLYTSFRERRVRAQYRTMAGQPGPKRTAESYLLEALLDQGEA